MAEEINGEGIGKNQTTNFIKLYKDRLKSFYLCNINNLQSKSRVYCTPIFKCFNNLVK
jgi:hypothetical protein